MRSKTFDEFWQVFLQVTFHQDNPERWSIRESKAQWIKSCLELLPGNSIADLGCGDGILDIWLSRMGYKVTAIDRSPSIISHARAEDDTDLFKFVVRFGLLKLLFVVTLRVGKFGDKYIQILLEIAGEKIRY